MNFLQRQLEDPVRFKLIKVGFYVLLVLIALSEIVLPHLFHPHEAHFWFENLPAWGSLYGLISCILIITIPLAFLVILIWLIALYVAKLPVALWLGRWALRAISSGFESRVAALVVGLLILYVLFAIPVLGWFVWFACLFVGLGAIILGIRDMRAARIAAAGQGPAGPPAPGPPAGPMPPITPVQPAGPAAPAP